MSTRASIATRQPLAVAFFLLAHDPFDDGKLRISTELLGCGLVGTELAELILARRLMVSDDRLVIADAGGDDEADRYVLENVANQDTAHPVKSWIEPLQDGLYMLIGDRLVAAGLLRREKGSRRIARGGYQPDRFPPNDLLAATRPQQELERMLARPRDLTLAGGMLAAVVDALGLDELLNPDMDRSTLRRLLSEIAQHLPPDLRAVYQAVKAVTAEVSLRAR